MSESLSIEQARKMVLHSQRLPPSHMKGRAIDVTLSMIAHLGYVQIDTLSVVQRAHHHTLWSRNPRYQSVHLEQLVTDKKVFEYWSHAASYLPMSHYRFSLPRKFAIKTGVEKHWYPRDEKMICYVLDRIAAEGPLLAKAFQYNGEKLGIWQSKPAKQALECLFMQGDLMIESRQNFQKVYALTEHVLPSDINDTLPTEAEHARHLVFRFLKANGMASIGDFGYLLKRVKPSIKQALATMVHAKEVVIVTVSGNDYYALSESLALLNKPLAHQPLKILSPFDNLLIQRQRMRELFNFDYQLECYVPKAKRVYGYFVLPILWQGRFAARMDCKADRKTGALHIYSLHLESWVKKREDFDGAFENELRKFMSFNQCRSVLRSDA